MMCLFTTSQLKLTCPLVSQGFCMRVCACFYVHVCVHSPCASLTCRCVHVAARARASPGKTKHATPRQFPPSLQRPQCISASVCDQSHVDQSWCQDSSGSDSFPLSPFLSPHLYSLCLPFLLLFSPLLLSIHASLLTVWKEGLPGQERAWSAHHP